MNQDLDKLNRQVEEMPTYNALLFPLLKQIVKQIVKVLYGLENRVRAIEKRSEETEG